MSNTPEDYILEQVKALPELPGVYRYYDKSGSLLYIGKAKNLKKRVNSYFTGDLKHSARIKLLVRKIRDIQYTVVNTERDALLLENSLIKEYQPKYNIALKDDKSFPYIKIVREPFPRVFFSRNYKNDGAEYFGPYTSLHQVRSLVELIKKLYPIRSCKLHLNQKNISSGKFRVCLEYHIGNCLGPCAGLQSESAYLENIRDIRSILKGKLNDIRHLLKKRMDEAAAQLKFEEAETWKAKLLSLKEYMDLSIVVNPGLGNFHVFGYYEDEQKAYINYLYVFDGTIVKAKNLTISRKLNETKEYLLMYAILDILGKIEVKEEILVPFHLEELSEIFSIVIPKISEKKKLLNLAIKNAFLIKQNELRRNSGISKEERILQLMKEELQLKKLPKRIECFDNSNFQGNFPVASMVVFINGKPSKTYYRHYNIKTVEGPNDFASMEEIVYRRYKSLMDERQELPDLIVIDGGKGQLASALKSIEKLGIRDKVEIISIAKRLEEIYFPNDAIPLHINKRSETLKVLQHIRNEAHRFAITFHRAQRNRSTVRSQLTEIKGVGPKTIDLLLSKLGSLKKIREATQQQIEEVVGKSKGTIIFDALHPKKNSPTQV